MKLIIIVEILGIISFAFSGAVSAMQKRLDVFGVLIITFVTSIGGGTIRDMLIGSFPVGWLLDINLIATIFITYLFALFFHHYFHAYAKIIFWMDTIGLAVFTMVAITKGLQFHLHPVVCVALGTVTGCFGGILRDVLLNEIPYVFRKDIYASASIAGGIVYFVAAKLISDHNIASLIAGAVIVLIRVGAKYKNWRLPLIYTKENPDENS
ncbi:MAG: trimeric intracellular cation channel family protein [Bacteroidia bacterium]